MPATQMPTSQRDLVAMSLLKCPAPKPRPSLVSRDHHGR